MDELQLTERPFIKKTVELYTAFPKPTSQTTEKWNQNQTHANHNSSMLQEQIPKSLYRVDLAQQAQHFQTQHN